MIRVTPPSGFHSSIWRAKSWNCVARSTSAPGAPCGRPAPARAWRSSRGSPALLDADDRQHDGPRHAGRGGGPPEVAGHGGEELGVSGRSISPGRRDLDDRVDARQGRFELARVGICQVEARLAGDLDDLVALLRARAVTWEPTRPVAPATAMRMTGNPFLGNSDIFCPRTVEHELGHLSSGYDPPMKLSGGVEWAVHCCVVLSQADEPVPAQRLAEYHGVSRTYLAKHLQQLSRAGLVASTEGRVGGYALTRAAQDITVLDVVLAIEGNEPAFRCTEIRQNGPFPATAQQCRRPCGIARAMYAAEDAWRHRSAA